jgi:cobalt-zinc-cadmium efflux system membrane fusion protein
MRLRDLPRSRARRYVLGTVIAAAAAAGAVRVFELAPGYDLSATASAAPAGSASDSTSTGSASQAPSPAAAPTIELTDKQLQTFKIEPVGSQVFPLTVDAVGSIDFNEDLETQVFTNYQGRIVSLFAKVGDDVQKGQPLFTIDSPDLVQAESTLISAAGVLRLTNRAMDRAKELAGVKGLAQKDFDQAVSDQQTAEGNYKAAVDAVRIFGKTADEIDRIATTRKLDSILVIPSPISGRVTVRNAAPGLFVQPGSTPAPFTVADISTMWMIGNVAESNSGSIRLGQDVTVTVMAYPGHIYKGKITTVAATVDPTLHTMLVRSEILDPAHELRAGMFANFEIRVGTPVTATAVPADAVVREGDGTMTAWVTTDRHHFTQRVVTIGRQYDGYDQILGGLQQGELVVSDGAIFIDNMLTASPTD